MRHLIIAAAALALAPFVAAAEDTMTATAEQMAQIDHTLSARSCEVDPVNVVVEGGVFDLDDVMCADGQYDMKLDAGYNIIEERKE
ncbi:PepSY domain-containing protein [Amaricoccus sp.]|uniref:PepSY domain-containing protein n=1 Tax=Amaricoccus sp. TaxID=1872485 RepID=UPI001B3F88AB|nr:PepSY domain-containing protein [Amaricoccus sp.]MBP7243360.1 PepSY domain-containing protein [Amaricoccus sp.]